MNFFKGTGSKKQDKKKSKKNSQTDEENVQRVDVNEFDPNFNGFNFQQQQQQQQQQQPEVSAIAQQLDPFQPFEVPAASFDNYQQQQYDNIGFSTAPAPAYEQVDNNNYQQYAESGSSSSHNPVDVLIQSFLPRASNKNEHFEPAGASVESNESFEEAVDVLAQNSSFAPQSQQQVTFNDNVEFQTNDFNWNSLTGVPPAAVEPEPAAASAPLEPEPVPVAEPVQAESEPVAVVEQAPVEPASAPAEPAPAPVEPVQKDEEKERYIASYNLSSEQYDLVRGFYDSLQKDGRLDNSLLQNVMNDALKQRKEVRVSEEDVNRSLAAVDGDNDGKITFDEFIRLLLLFFARQSNLKTRANAVLNAISVSQEKDGVFGPKQLANYGLFLQKFYGKEPTLAANNNNNNNNQNNESLEEENGIDLNKFENEVLPELQSSAFVQPSSA